MRPKLFKNKLRIVKKELPENMDILFISAFGSWNYGLQTETSDIDFKVVYIPSLDELIRPKDFSFAGSTINISYIGQCEIISIQSFIDKIKVFDISKIEILFAPNIWVNDVHKPLFETIKSHTLDYIIGNKVRYIDSVITVCTSIYKTFINSDMFKYNGKKAYNIPRLKYLLNGVLYSNEYELMIDDQEVRNDIMQYKLGNVDRDDARSECSVIINRMTAMKDEFNNENENSFNDKITKFDEIVKNGIYTEIIREKEEKRIKQKVNKLATRCRSSLNNYDKLNFIIMWVSFMFIICMAATVR